eukprot:TRINITY_DN21481_c0_g1_i1.p1 TRINITY_DN21481_c0_g1~~TRINITY_DN21481_c0_g1_i1.p1  ORF type:complete len:362 (-),score=90.58 TRINITY_DN21481_c0_g1_i1:248-1333(-)
MPATLHEESGNPTPESRSPAREDADGSVNGERPASELQVDVPLPSRSRDDSGPGIISAGMEDRLSSLVADGLRMLRNGPEYAAAYELELWRRAEEKKFRAYLADLETRQREKLEEEYRQREIQRAQEFRQKRGELQNVEARARKKLQDLQQREVAVAAESARVASLRDEVKRRTDATVQDYEDTARRQVAEAQQSLQLERSRSRHLEERVKELEEEVTAVRRRAREAEAEADERRRNFEEAPASQLHLELQEARFELQEERRRSETLAASRDHFKGKVEELCRRLADSAPSALAVLPEAAASAAHAAHLGGAIESSVQEPQPEASGAPALADALRRIQDDLRQRHTIGLQQRDYRQRRFCP